MDTDKFSHRRIRGRQADELVKKAKKGADKEVGGD
jgi:hypothetical protein